MADKDVESDAPGCQDEDSDRTLPIDADVPSIPPPSPEDVFRDMLENPEPTPPGSWEPVSPEKLNQLLPGFQVIKLLGRGGMGAVYEAIQENLDRHVAIKVLPPELGRDIEFEARFRREAKAMARLNHPNIIQIYDFGQTSEGHFYFVMEFVDGSDLHFLIKKGLIKPDTALKLAIQICEALQFAHDEGFVHRDIKPANILLTSTGVIKIGDFGLAKLIDPNVGSETDKMGLTMTGYSMGTPNYMAPEQMNGENQIDHRADIYSLGVMLYEMLTGEIPRGAFDPPSNKTPVDARIDDVVLKAMHEKPDFRYQAAKDIESDVTTIRTSPRGYTIAAKERKERTKAVSKSNIWLRVIAVLLLSAAVITGAVIWQPSEQSVGNTTLPTTENEKSQLEIPPALSEMKKRGGRLRAWYAEGATAKRPSLAPSEGKDDFISIVSSGADWMALRANGSVVHSDPNIDVFRNLTDVVKVATGGPSMALRKNGDIVTNLSKLPFQQKLARPIPGDVKDFAITYSGGAFVLNSGKVTFRYWTISNHDKYSNLIPDWEAKANQRNDNVAVAIHDPLTPSILRADGTFLNLGFDKSGGAASSESPSQQTAVAIARGGHKVALLNDGSLSTHHWDGYEDVAGETKVPEDLDRCVAVKAMYRISAAQMEDGSWRAWGNNDLGVVDKINSLGPALDIAFDAGKGFVYWLEPVEEQEEAHSIPQLKLPPALAEMKKRGGRLRGWVKNGQEDLLQLSKADGIDDVIELDGTLSSYDSRESARWVAKRRGGSTATSLENFPRANEIISLNSHVGVLRTGEFFDCWSDQRKIRAELSDAVDADYQTGPLQCKLVLRRNGSLSLADTSWSKPELKTVRNRIEKVTDVVKIEQGYMASAILRSNGEVIGWAGYDLLETLSPGRKFVDIAASGMVGALDTEGNVSIWKREGVVPLPEERLEKGYAIRASGNLFAI